MKLSFYVNMQTRYYDIGNATLGLNHFLIEQNSTTMRIRIQELARLPTLETFAFIQINFLTVPKSSLFPCVDQLINVQTMFIPLWNYDITRHTLV